MSELEPAGTSKGLSYWGNRIVDRVEEHSERITRLEGRFDGFEKSHETCMQRCDKTLDAIKGIEITLAGRNGKQTESTKSIDEKLDDLQGGMKELNECLISSNLARVKEEEKLHGRISNIQGRIIPLMGLGMLIFLSLLTIIFNHGRLLAK